MTPQPELLDNLDSCETISYIALGCYCMRQGNCFKAGYSECVRGQLQRAACRLGTRADA